MANKTKVFVCIDYENDKKYKALLESMKGLKDYELVFYDKIPNDITSSNVEKIKKELVSKLDEAELLLVIVGKGSNLAHKDSKLIGHKNWINFAVAQFVENVKSIALVRLDNAYNIPVEVLRGRYSLIDGFTEENVVNILYTASRM